MTIACAVHWYESLLFIAPVAMTVGVIGVMSRVERRREEREAAGENAPCRIRTCDLVLRRDALYPAELRAPAEHRSGWARPLGVWMARGNCPTTEVKRCVACVLWQRGSLPSLSVPAAPRRRRRSCRPPTGCRTAARWPPGQRSYVEGFEDGRFYANGWHTTGEMGGVWAPPLKLVDGVWFGIDDQWVGQATKFTSGWGYTRYDLPDTGGLHVQRTDFAPDANRAALFGLHDDQPRGGRQDGHGEGRRALRADGRVPVGLHGRDAQRQRQPRRPRRVHRQGARVHRRRRAAGRARAPLRGARRRQPDPAVRRRRRPTGGSFRGPQPGHACTGTDGDLAARARATTARSARAPAASCATASPCRPRGSKTLWVAVAGSDQGLADAQQRAGRRAAGPGRRSSRPRSPRASAGEVTRRSRCPATGCCRTRSTGASRTSPT